jgi:hypothetical protein
MVIGNPIADSVDDCGDRLCNIESTAGTRPNGASAMVTAELPRHPRVTNADTVDRSDVPQTSDPARGGAIPSRKHGKPAS